MIRSIVTAICFAASVVAAFAGVAALFASAEAIVHGLMLVFVAFAVICWRISRRFAP